jgi:hypothetical protein
MATCLRACALKRFSGEREGSERRFAYFTLKGGPFVFTLPLTSQHLEG